jgi:hypothetical protein
MQTLESVIRENQDEFLNLVLEFVKEKTKKRKGPKTICHFQALGKTYDNHIFSKNYGAFLKDVSRILSYESLEPILKSYLRKNIDDFSDNTTERSTLIHLENGGYVTTYSSTEKKITHIQDLCQLLNANLKILKKDFFF